MIIKIILFLVAVVIGVSAFFLFIATIVGGAGDKVACSVCGHRFKRKYVNTILSELDTAMYPKSNYLKCPKCKMRNECSSSRLA